MKNNTHEIIHIDNTSKLTNHIKRFLIKLIAFMENISDKIEEIYRKIFQIEIWH